MKWPNLIGWTANDPNRSLQQYLLKTYFAGTKALWTGRTIIGSVPVTTYWQPWEVNLGVLFFHITAQGHVGELGFNVGFPTRRCGTCTGGRNLV